MTTMRDFPIFDMATETMTLRLKCWRSRISLVDETSRFFLACAYTRSFCVFTGVATVNVFSSVNCFTLYQENCHCAVYFGPPCTYIHTYIHTYICSGRGSDQPKHKRQYLTRTNHMTF